MFFNISIDSPDELRKKASVLFGIRFDEKKYDDLKKDMKSIKENSDLVSILFNALIFKTIRIGNKKEFPKQFMFLLLLSKRTYVMKNDFFSIDRYF